jgi:hypothetical protein
VTYTNNILPGPTTDTNEDKVARFASTNFTVAPGPSMPSEPLNTAYSIDTGGSGAGDPMVIDTQEYIEDPFASVFNPLLLGRNLAIAAQTPYLLNAKAGELQELQALAQQRLLRSRARLAEGLQRSK